MLERTKNGIQFLALFLVSFVIVYGVVAFGTGFSVLSNVNANTSAYILSLIGTNARVENQGIESVLYVQDKIIVISALCTGWFEIALLVAAILATFHTTRRQQVIGIGLAILGGFLFNQVRIITSIQQILHTDIQIAELTHDVLFRLFMLVVVVGLYAGWLKWARNDSDQGMIRAKIVGVITRKKKVNQ